jgi:hypothetical protein
MMVVVDVHARCAVKMNGGISRPDRASKPANLQSVDSIRKQKPSSV